MENYKLKTLKDLENVKNETLKYLIKEFEKGKVNNNIITSTYFLREEAINWIKEIDNLDKTPQDKLWEQITGNTITYSEEGKQAIINFIKYFFNIEENDLMTNDELKIREFGERGNN